MNNNDTTTTADRQRLQAEMSHIEQRIQTLTVELDALNELDRRLDEMDEYETQP